MTSKKSDLPVPVPNYASFASRIGLAFATLDGNLHRTSDEEATYRFFKPVMDFVGVIGQLMFKVIELPESPGLEPYLRTRGFNTVGARGLAYLAVRSAKRSENECSRRRVTYAAIRFLATPGRQQAVSVRKAKILLDSGQQTTILITPFKAAGLLEDEFLGLLQQAIDGNSSSWLRIQEIAAVVAPHLAIERGPKVSAATLTYEQIQANLDNIPKALRRPYRQRSGEEYVDPFTEAIRKEFNDPNFDPRPARRRKRRAAGDR